MNKLTALLFAAMLALGAGAVQAKDEKSADAGTKMEKPAKAEPLDINSASEDELAALPGIGPVRSKAIIAGRPYKGKDDLVKSKVLPAAVYKKIKDKIIAKQK